MRNLKSLETHNFAHSPVRLLWGHKIIRKIKEVRIWFLNDKDLACPQKKSHRTFVLAVLTRGRQTGRVDVPLAQISKTTVKWRVSRRHQQTAPASNCIGGRDNVLLKVYCELAVVASTVLAMPVTCRDGQSSVYWEALPTRI